MQLTSLTRIVSDARPVVAARVPMRRRPFSLALFRRHAVTLPSRPHVELQVEDFVIMMVGRANMTAIYVNCYAKHVDGGWSHLNRSAQHVNSKFNLLPKLFVADLFVFGRLVGLSLLLFLTLYAVGPSPWCVSRVGRLMVRWLRCRESASSV
jgi:hypothetical protein